VSAWYYVEFSMNVSHHIWLSHVKYEWVMSHTNESCHIWMRHAKRMNESCHMYDWGSRITYTIEPCNRWRVTSHMNQLIHSFIKRNFRESVMSNVTSTYLWMRHLTHINEWCQTHQWVKTHMNESCHVDTCKNESCHTHEWLMQHLLNESCPRVMQHTRMRHATSKHVTYLLHICDMAAANVWHNSFIRVRKDTVTRVTWLCHMYVWHDSCRCMTWLLHMCDMTPSCVTWLLHLCEAWLLRMLDTPPSYVCHGSCKCVTWLLHKCDTTPSYAWHTLTVCDARPRHMYDMTHFVRVMTQKKIKLGGKVERRGRKSPPFNHVCDVTPPYAHHDSKKMCT